MICTINFSKNLNSDDYKNLLNLFNSKSESKYQKTIHYKNGICYNYRFKNFIFFLSENKLKGIGSLTKLALNNNLQNASLHQIEYAIKEIEHFLDIDIDDAVINRLDVGYTLSVEERPIKYINIISTPSGCKKYQVGENETLYLKGKASNLSFYDKNLESYSKREYKMLCKQNDFKLRYEVEVKKICQILDLTEVKVADVRNSYHYHKLVDYWFNQFNKLQFKNDGSNIGFDFSNLKELKYSLEVQGVLTLGIEAIREALSDVRIKKSSRFRMNEFLNRLKIFNNKTSLEQEVRSKIHQAYLTIKQPYNFLT